jgi:hypothetical protein
VRSALSHMSGEKNGRKNAAAKSRIGGEARHWRRGMDGFEAEDTPLELQSFIFKLPSL